MHNDFNNEFHIKAYDKKVINSGRAVKLCWNHFFVIANGVKVMKGIKLCQNEFLIKGLYKKVTKSGGGVKLCWNEFLIKANDKKCKKVVEG